MKKMGTLLFIGTKCLIQLFSYIISEFKKRGTWNKFRELSGMLVRKQVFDQEE